MKKNILAFLTMALITLVASATYADELTAAQHFEKGAKLIEDNHYDAVGSTKAGMEAGIQHVKDALRLGYPDKRQAYLLLIGAYGQLKIYSEPGSDAESRLLADKNNYLQMLYQLDPNDEEILTQYAELTTDKEEQLRAYKKLSALRPEMARPHFVIAMSLINAGDTRGGIAEIKTWLGLERNHVAVNAYVRRTVDLLAEKGCVVPNQDTWFPRFLKIRLDLEAANSNVREQARLSLKNAKLDFLTALDKTKCP